MFVVGNVMFIDNVRETPSTNIAPPLRDARGAHDLQTLHPYGVRDARALPVYSPRTIHSSLFGSFAGA